MCVLAEKFENVEVTKRSRLEEADRLFCEEQQKLYHNVLNHHKTMFDGLMTLKKQTAAFYEPVKEQNEYQSGGYTYKRYYEELIDIDKVDKNCFSKFMLNVHARFISQINGYFKNKYGVDIKNKDFSAYSHLIEPKIPDSWGRDAEKWKQYRLDKENYINSIIAI